ncbi:unnamed protein product, partial [Amoebophrya sp. A120]
TDSRWFSPEPGVLRTDLTKFENRPDFYYPPTNSCVCDGLPDFSGENGHGFYETSLIYEDDANAVLAPQLGRDVLDQPAVFSGVAFYLKAATASEGTAGTFISKAPPGAVAQKILPSCFPCSGVQNFTQFDSTTDPIALAVHPNNVGPRIWAPAHALYKTSSGCFCNPDRVVVWTWNGTSGTDGSGSTASSGIQSAVTTTSAQQQSTPSSNQTSTTSAGDETTTTTTSPAPRLATFDAGPCGLTKATAIYDADELSTTQGRQVRPCGFALSWVMLRTVEFFHSSQQLQEGGATGSSSSSSNNSTNSSMQILQPVYG